MFPARSKELSQPMVASLDIQMKNLQKVRDAVQRGIDTCEAS